MADEDGKSSRRSVASTSTAAPPPSPFSSHGGAVTAAFLTSSYYSTPAMGSHLSGSSDRQQNNNSSRIVAGGPGVPLSVGGSSSQGVPATPPPFPTVAFPSGTMIASHAPAPTPYHISQLPPLPPSVLVKPEFPVPTQQACAGCGAACGALEIKPQQPSVAALLPPMPFLTPYIPPVPHFTNFPSHYSSLLPGKETSAALARATLMPASSAYSTPAVPLQSISSGPANIPLPIHSPNQPKMEAINSKIPSQTWSCNQTQHGSPPIPLPVRPSAKVPTAPVPEPPISIVEPTPIPDSLPREPVSLGGRGEGWPYAPQGWPHSDDKWGWRVGKRSASNGLWIDRYITLPKSLAKGRKVVEFASRKGLTEFLKLNFPHMNADSIFNAFDWKVPAVKVPEAPKVLPTKRDKTSLHTGDSSCQRPKKKCRAGNPHCYLETGKSSVSGAAETLVCHICCSELGFCRECKCILCCKAFTLDTDDIDVIRCLNRPIAGAGICNHAAHLECAVNSQLAGVIKKNGLDVEYMCRRCDRKTDLRESVSRLIESMGRTTLQSKVERNLRLALRIMQDSQDAENLPSRTLSVLIEKVLKKVRQVLSAVDHPAGELIAVDHLEGLSLSWEVQMGADIQDTYKELTQQALAYEAGRSQATGSKGLFEALLHHSEASLDKWLALYRPPASQPLPITPTSVTSLEQDPNTCAVGPPQGDANDKPTITHMQVNGTVKHNSSDEVVSTSPIFVQPEHIANGCLMSTPLQILAEIDQPIPVSVSGLIHQSVSRSSAFSIEEHIKQCEAIANRVKGAGQLITPDRGLAVSQFPATEVDLSSVVKGAGQISVTGVEFSSVVEPHSSSHEQATGPPLGVVLSSPVRKSTVSLPGHGSDTQSIPTLQPALDVSPNREALELSEVRRVEACTIPSPRADLESRSEGLEAEFDTQVDLALKKLKTAQAAEYTRAESSLLNQKKIVLEEYQHLGCVCQDFAKQEKAQQSAPNTTGDLSERRVQIDQAMNRLLDQFAKAKEAHKVFQSMLGISSGFGKVSKDFLEQYFERHTWDLSGNP